MEYTTTNLSQSFQLYSMYSTINLSSGVLVMEYAPRGELFSAWQHYGHFSEALVQIYIAELAIVIGKSSIQSQM